MDISTHPIEKKKEDLLIWPSSSLLGRRLRRLIRVIVKKKKLDEKI